MNKSVVIRTANTTIMYCIVSTETGPEKKISNIIDIYIRNRMGPKTIPCGTPLLTYEGDDKKWSF